MIVDTDRPATERDLEAEFVAFMDDAALREYIVKRLRERRDVDEMTVAQAAVSVGRSPQTIVLWARAHAIGHRSPLHRRWLISRRKLMAYHRKRFGRLPPGERA
jgi:hypothetical protein